ncbi:MAG: SRPBCC family protein [Gemmatimonadota bacterium]|nr:SRPBCC family protein [Gemmatimonadota bacterium]
MTSTPTSTDRIEKQIVLDATQSRVWRAVTDYREFNAWFGVAFTTPFKVGGKSSGNITIKGYDHMVMDAWVEKIEPETFFSFRWHPNATDANVDYSKDPTTLVSFTLEKVKEGTKLTIVETGFDSLPEWRRATAFKSNDSGWASQTKRIAEFIRANP